MLIKEIDKKAFCNIVKFRKIDRPKVISLFSGCGGLDLGFHYEGYKIIWANDNNKYATQSFENYFGKDIIHCDDIAKINPYDKKAVPDCQLILGGFPCQDFSIIWKRPGLNGERGNIYKEYLRFVDAKKPLAFIAENVKGLITIHNYKAIEQIINDFENIIPGYLIFPKLYNFADYGVPQFRERVILVGIRMDTCFDFKHPKPTHGPKADKPYLTSGEALKGAENAIYNNEHMHISKTTIERLMKIPKGGNFSCIAKDDPHYVKGMISHVYRRIDPDKPAMTVIAAGGGGTHGYYFPEPRALTFRERARLQSFPDNFKFEGGPAEVRRQIGNAVPPQGVRSLAKALMNLFTKNYRPIDLKKKSEELKMIPIKERIEVDV